MNWAGPAIPGGFKSRKSFLVDVTSTLDYSYIVISNFYSNHMVADIYTKQTGNGYYIYCT